MIVWVKLKKGEDKKYWLKWSVCNQQSRGKNVKIEIKINR